MVVMPAGEPITLKEIQLRLGVPQHVLIHLCEKGVIEPDFAETSGRGKRREFSRRNLFEFGVALALRRVELPVATVALLVRILRSFFRAVRRAQPGLLLPESLGEEGVDVSLRLFDGERLVLIARWPTSEKPVLVSAKLTNGAPRVTRAEELPRDYQVRLDVNLSEIARKNSGGRLR